MRRKRQKGFTLIELMTGLLAGGIMVLAAGTVLVTSHVAWDNALEKADLQREASYTMLRMTSHIQAATAAEVEGEGTAIRIYTEAGWVRFFGNDSYDLKCHVDGHSEVTINDNTETLGFNVVGNVVTIALELRKGNFHTGLASTVMMRNYGG